MMEVEPEPEDWTDPESVRKLDQDHHIPPTFEQRVLDVIGALLVLLVTGPIFAIVVAYYRIRSVVVGGSPSAFHTERRMSGGRTVHSLQVPRSQAAVRAR